ncbi:MAG: hypothetical protein U1E77_00125 [Inhella sp.]
MDAAMHQGLPIDDPAVQKLTHRWMALLLEWMGGDMDLMDRWAACTARSQARTTSTTPSSAMMAYVEQAIALRMQVLRPTAPHTREMAQIGFVPLAHWQALENEVTALLARGEAPGNPPRSPPWLDRLMDQLCGPARPCALGCAWTTEPCCGQRPAERGSAGLHRPCRRAAVASATATANSMALDPRNVRRARESAPCLRSRPCPSPPTGGYTPWTTCAPTMMASSASCCTWR